MDLQQLAQGGRGGFCQPSTRLVSADLALMVVKSPYWTEGRDILLDLRGCTQRTTFHGSASLETTQHPLSSTNSIVFQRTEASITLQGTLPGFKIFSGTNYAEGHQWDSLRSHRATRIGMSSRLIYSSNFSIRCDVKGVF